MEKISSIRDLINLWPRRADLADDIRSLYPGLHVTTQQVHKWAEKGSIPARYHHAFLAAAKARSLPISAEQLAFFSAPVEARSA